MAHFDSLKNEAIWELEMKKLRSEREFRRENKAAYLKTIQENNVKSVDTPYRRKTTLAELIRAEELSRGIVRKEGRTLQPTLQKDALEKAPIEKGAM